LAGHRRGSALHHLHERVEIHLGGIHALRHHALHHLLHFGRHVAHPAHARPEANGRKPHGRVGHAGAEEILHVFDRLFLVSGCLPERLLLQAVACPRELVEAVVEKVGHVGPWPAPGLVIVRKIWRLREQA
jgi:hypothetical protein